MHLTSRYQTYPEGRAAREAVAQLSAAGTHPQDVQLLIGRRVRDIRNEPVGTFAGTIGPDAPIGTFGGVTRLRRQAAGGWGSNPDSRRQGSFGDAEHDELVTFDHGREVSRTVDRRRLVRMLRPVAHDRAHARELVSELHSGHALTLIAHAAETVASAERRERAPLAA